MEKQEQEQDLENPARKEVFKKNFTKNDSENVMDDIDDNSNNNYVDIEYNIDYLVDDDEKLIDVEKVKFQVDTYIDNYNSDIMKQYKIKFDKLYQKYGNPKYKIQTIPVKDKYNSIKIIVRKNAKTDKNETIITEITKPNYIFYDNNSNLYNLKNNISNTRAELLYKYEILVAQLNVSIEDKKEFEKERVEFINLLEEYYTYTLYHKKINKNITNKKTKLIINSKYNLEKKDDIISVLSGDTYYIDDTLIDSINNYNIDKLTNYNNIILQLSGKNQKDIKKDTKLIEEMKLYLDKKEKEELNKKLEESKIQQDNYVNYIISRLPNI
jgi:hypothetical protein